MMLRALNYPTPALRQCSNRARIASTTIGCSSAATTATSSNHQLPKNDDDTTTFTQHHRQFSSLPHHLARQNNGMVNVLVKSTKVPRPTLPKTLNQLKKSPNKKDVTVEEEEEHVPSHFSYAGNVSMPITSELKIVKPGEDTPSGIWPVFRMMVCHMIRVVL